MMRNALLGGVIAALIAVIAGVESTVEGGTAAVLRSCSPQVLLAALALLVLSFVVSRAAWIRSALASIESSEPGTAARVLSGACAGFAILTTITLHWSLQISSLIAVATVVAGVAVGVVSSRRGPWLAVLAVPAFVLAVEFFSVASAILAGVIVVGGG
ncbi:MAG TPA: hypothetical protein VFS19_06725, partial [Planctomycetota bacterium]|nr:hypothetical protein [Planctomycetota bacterium]